MNKKAIKAILIVGLCVVPLILVVKILWTKIRDARFTSQTAIWRVQKWPEERERAADDIRLRQLTNETVNATLIDLRPHINTALTDSPASPKGNKNNNLAALPKGTNIYAGIPFDVEGLVQLAGSEILKFGKKYPKEVDNIAIGRECTKIHLFHGANWAYRKDFGTIVAKVILHYSDNTTHTFDLVSGKQVFDWWGPLHKTGVSPQWNTMAPGTERAWTGTNSFIAKYAPDFSLCLYKITFENPQPAKTVVSLDYVSTVTMTAPFLAGLTVE